MSVAGFSQRKLRQHWSILMALFVRGMSVLAAFAVTFFIGRNFGADVTGQYALITQTAMFLAITALLGLDISVVRHFAKAAGEKVPVALGSFGQVVGLGVASVAVLAAVLWIGGTPLWDRFFGDVVTRTFLPLLCLLIAARAGVQLMDGLLRSQHRFTLGQTISALFIPLATAIALATGAATSLDEILVASIGGGFLAVAIGLIAITPHVATGPTALRIPVRIIIASSLPLWGAGVAQVIGNWYGLAVAAQVLGAAEAGFFRVAVQIAAGLQIISSALQSVYSGRISSAFHAGNHQQAALLARSSVRWSTTLALPATIAILIAGKWILGEIGPEFVAAWPVLVVLLIGQLAFTITGPCGLVLAMSGHERVNLRISLVSMFTLLVSAPVAASYGGLLVMAICIALTMLMRNFIALFCVRRLIGINIWAGTATAPGSNSK